MRDRVDVEVQSDGSYVETRELIYRILNEQGARWLRQVNLSYTQGYQSYAISAAYTLKKDGTRIDVERRNMLRGYGATSAPGFDRMVACTEKKSTRSVMNSAWSAMPENVVQTAWMPALAPAMICSEGLWLPSGGDGACLCATGC